MKITTELETRDAKQEAVNRWSCIPEELIDKVVEAMKESRRFKRDAPTLRALNRHWRDCVNKHIVSVHPHPSRILVRKDVASLYRLPNLTSIDITPFAQLGIPRLTRNSVRYPVVDAVVPLKSLKQLSMDGKTLSRIAGEEFMRLRGVTSVHVSNGSVGNSDLSKLAQLPVEELVLECGSLISSAFLQKMTALCRLDASLSDCMSETDQRRLGRIQSVELRLAKEIRTPPVDMQSVVSLDCTSSGLESLDGLIGLPKLKSLAIAVESAAMIEADSFALLIANLTTLDLRSSTSWLRISRNFLAAATSLRSLSLQLFDFDGAVFDSARLERLKILSLKSCIVTNGLSFLRSLTQLETISLERNVSRNKSAEPSISLLKNHLTLKHLELHLTSWRELDDFVSFSDLATLECLETLELYGALKNIDQDIKPITRFTNTLYFPALTKLAFSGEIDIDPLKYVITRFTSLGLERLCLLPHLPYEQTGIFIDFVQRLKRRYPSLIIET